MTIQTLDANTALVDLHFQGQPQAIGTGVIDLGDGIALVDPGPTTCLPALREGLDELGFALADVRAVLLTHIHLDHATASGTILAGAPEARLYVHPLGAIHMINPERLLASAGRIYGDRMGTLWGEFLSVPESSVIEVDEGDSIELGDRSFRVAYAPGHAKHHVAYYEDATATAWVGDVAGIRIPQGEAIPVTPPPDIDVEVWIQSMNRVSSWNPSRLVPTHFGPIDDPATHFEDLELELRRWADRVRESLEGDDPDNPDSDADRVRAGEFTTWAEADLRDRMSGDIVDTYIEAFGATDSWWGLARYWRKKGLVRE